MYLGARKWPVTTPRKHHYNFNHCHHHHHLLKYLVPWSYSSQLREKFVNIRSKLSELSKCQAIILGNQYDLQHVNDILHAIDKRQELWKYCDVSSHTIREWLQTVFKKVWNNIHGNYSWTGIGICCYLSRVWTKVHYHSKVSYHRSSLSCLGRWDSCIKTKILYWDIRLLNCEMR